jgi:hypothetical protein
MPSNSHGAPHNAFAHEFLARLDQLGEPEGAHEADVAGPWAIRPVAYHGGTGFGLLREWESVEQGDVPYAVFRRREMALLAAAVLPATGREPLFRLRKQPDSLGFALESDCPAGAGPDLGAGDLRKREDDVAGHLRDFDQDFAAALHLAAAMVRSPVAMARLLEAAGFVALEQAGRILHSSVHGGGAAHRHRPATST